MTRLYPALILAFALLTLALPRASRAADEAKGKPTAAEERWTAEITDRKGSVVLRHKDETKFKEAVTGAELEEGDVVRTGKDGAVEITLDGESMIVLGKNSEFVVGEKRKSKGSARLTLGSLLAKFAALAKGATFQVKSPSAVAAIRGTEFGVSADSSSCRVGVFDEGVVEVTGPGGEGGVTLHPNEETQVAQGGQPLPATSLKFFAFEKVRMAQIRKRLDYVRKQWRRKNQGQRDELRKKLQRYQRKDKPEEPQPQDEGGEK